MPPLLAALLMMEFGCDLRIVQAIDLSVEWRLYAPKPLSAQPSNHWYAGWIGVSAGDRPWPVCRGTYAWPCSVYKRRYAQ
jgi:hypothetical protein